MNKIFLLLIFFFLTSQGFSQQQTKVTGIIHDFSNNPVAGATVTLLKAADSSVVKFAAAGKEGGFVFEAVPGGRYLVSVSSAAHQPAQTAVFETNQSKIDVDLGTIRMQPQSKALGNIVVTARKPLVEQKIDRTLINVDASVTNAGSTALEVLEKSPGISVDRDGNISLKGKEGVLVLIDGRPSQLGGSDLANLLRSMNASQMEQVEIMTNPPAKYDAAGNAGIINIKTKKNRQMGYNATVSVNYTQGILPKFNESLNMNYRQGKVNLFTNLSHYYGEKSQELDIQRNFLNETTKKVVSHFDQEARMRNNRRSFNGKLGADYFAGKNTTVGLVLSGFANNGDFRNRNVTDIFSATGALSSTTRALSTQAESFDHFSTNLNFRQVLDTSGAELTADIDYLHYNGQNRQVLSNYYFSGGQPVQKGDTLFGNLPQIINIHSGRVDYLKPLGADARFEAGLKSSIVKTDNNALYDTLNNGAVIRDLNRSNHFIYAENINAAYVNLSGPLSKKFSGQLGLRIENTVATGNQLTTKQNFDRNYTQLFPTAFLQYKADDKNSFVLNYGRRIRRPNYESLNPFIEFLDRYTYQQGNPDLKPQFSHNIELSHNFKGFLNTTLNYSKTTDIIQMVIQQNEATNETYVKQANIASQNQLGIAFSFNKNITKWWMNSFYVNVHHNHYEGLVNSVPVSFDAFSMNLNGTQQFKISQAFSAELNGWFRSSGVEGVLLTRPMGGLNAGFTQQVMNNRGSIRLSFRDILWSQRFRASSRYGNVDAAFQERGDSRTVTIGFTYRFSKGKVNGVKRRNISASEEQNRVGGN